MGKQKNKVCFCSFCFFLDLFGFLDLDRAAEELRVGLCADNAVSLKTAAIPPLAQQDEARVDAMCEQEFIRTT